MMEATSMCTHYGKVEMKQITRPETHIQKCIRNRQNQRPNQVLDNYKQVYKGGNPPQNPYQHKLECFSITKQEHILILKRLSCSLSYLSYC
jgi:hypothetical protein